MQTFPIRPDNFEQISKLTGQSIEELKERYAEDQRNNQATFLMISEYKVRYNPDVCYYNYHWVVGQNKGVWVCAMHGQESKYAIDEGMRLPCLGVDPYP